MAMKVLVVKTVNRMPRSRNTVLVNPIVTSSFCTNLTRKISCLSLHI